MVKWFLFLTIFLIINAQNASIENSDEFWLNGLADKNKYLIKVYYPSSYLENSSLKYPVIYLSDADRYFNLAAGVIYTKLYREDLNVILVGIGYGSERLNNQKRRHDFRSLKGSQFFFDFIKNVLHPEIDRRYTIDPLDLTYIGWSAGAEFGLNSALKNDLFNNYILLSPRVKRDNWSAFEQLLKLSNTKIDLPINLYMSMGTMDRRFSDFSQFSNLIRSSNIKLELKIDHFPNYSHDVLSHINGLINGLDFIFVKPGIEIYIREIIIKEGLETAILSYKELIKNQPKDYNFNEDRLNKLSYEFLKEKKYFEAIELLKLNASTYPNSFNVYDSLGEAYYLKGDLKSAKYYYNKSLELNPKNQNAINVLKKI